MKIKQLTSYPIPNEIGLGNTNESYIRIENDINVSDIFPPNEEVVVTDCITGKSYKLKAKVSAEYRINQLGQIYRDYNFYPGDEIKFTQIDDNGKKTVFFSVTNFNRAYICVGPKGTEIVNNDRIAGYYLTATKTYNIPVDEGTLKLVFDKLEKKRNDSPNDTEFYCSTVNDVNLNKGIYFITIDGNKAVLEREKKNKVEEFFTLDGNNEKSVYTKDFPLQTIYYGAPGTGKSHMIDGPTNENNSIRTTFHPDTDYATFVGAYKPMMEVVDEYALDATGKTHKIDYPYGKSSITYRFEPQVFLKAYVEAWKRYLTMQEGEDDSYYLVIEEINRGNCAQIFGDLFQLLDRENGYSCYAISPDSSITKYLSEDAQSVDGTKFSDLNFSDVSKFRDGIEKIIATADDLKAGKKLILPPNLYIWATMNTSDQSLFPIDSAFKRRWEWKYVPIQRAEKETEKKWIIKVEHDSKTYWCYWWEFLEAINHQIEETTHSEDKQLGYFFAKPKAGESFISTETFVNKVIFYLWNDVFKDEDSPVFNYGNEKVEDVAINRAGNMYFRHFMENTDKMIHYFINQLFGMGKDNNPVVPIDYLKNDADSKVVEHLPKMRLDCEETPMPKLGNKVDGDSEDDVIGRVSDDLETCKFSNDIYKSIVTQLNDQEWMSGKTKKYFQNGFDVKFTDMAISYARLAITFDSSKTQSEIKLYIPSPSAYVKSGELYQYLKDNGIENAVESIATDLKVDWHELGDADPDSNKVKGWTLTLNINYTDDVETIVNQISEAAKKFFEEVDIMISSFSK